MANIRNFCTPQVSDKMAYAKIAVHDQLQSD